MSNIIQFPGHDAQPIRRIDGTPILFADLDAMANVLRESLELPDQSLMIRCVCAAARCLLSPEYGEADAIKIGFASLALARQRGLDLLTLIVELQPPSSEVA